MCCEDAGSDDNRVSLCSPMGDFYPAIWPLIPFRRCLRRTGGGLDMASPAKQGSVSCVSRPPSPFPTFPLTASPSQRQLQSSHCFQKGPGLQLAALVTQGELQKYFQGPSGQLAQCRPSWSVTELSAWGVWPPHLGPEPRPRHCTSKA